MKRVTSFFCALLLACSAAAAAACTDIPLKEVEAEIWTMPSTVKVLRDESYEEYYTDSPVLEVKLAKNESEGVQLIVTPEEDVSYYDVSVWQSDECRGRCARQGGRLCGVLRPRDEDDQSQLRPAQGVLPGCAHSDGTLGRKRRERHRRGAESGNLYLPDDEGEYACGGYTGGRSR